MWLRVGTDQCDAIIEVKGQKVNTSQGGSLMWGGGRVSSLRLPGHLIVD